MTFNRTRLFYLALPLMVICFAIPSCLKANVEDTVQKTFNVEEGGQLTLETQNGSVAVDTHRGNTVKIRVILKAETKRALEDFKIHFKQTGNDIFVKGECPRGGGFLSCSRNRVRARFEITVPKKYDLDLKTSGGSISVQDLEGEVKARTSGGSLNFGDIKGPIYGKTSGGSIRLEACSGDVEVRTSGGSLNIGKVKGGVTASTSGGSIRVEEVTDTINAGTSGGSVKVAISRQPRGDCSLKTSGGSITVYLPEDIKLDVDAKTSGGRVKTDFPVSMVVHGEMSKRMLKGKINGGGPQLVLRTSGGSIYIKKLD